MNRLAAFNALKLLDQYRKFVFLYHDIKKLFPNESRSAFNASLARLVKDGLIIHVATGVYLNPNAKSTDVHVIEHIAKALRRGFYNYISLESMLSEYGVISQIPVSRLTVMTTGRRGLYHTPYGTIEFTHTKRAIPEILKSIIRDEQRPLRLATKMTAIRDLKRVGRNTHLLNEDEADE